MAADDGSAMNTMEARLLASAITDIKAELRDIRDGMNGMRQALDALVRIDTEQVNFRQSIGRAFDEIKGESDKREKIEERIHLLEVDAPSYRELRRWVIGGVLTGIVALLGALFTIVFKVVISDPVERGFQRQAPPSPPISSQLWRTTKRIEITKC